MPPAQPDPERQDDAREGRVRWDLLFDGLSLPWIVLAILLYGGAIVAVVSAVFVPLACLKAMSEGF